MSVGVGGCRLLCLYVGVPLVFAYMWGCPLICLHVGFPLACMSGFLCFAYVSVCLGFAYVVVVLWYVDISVSFGLLIYIYIYRVSFLVCLCRFS